MCIRIYFRELGHSARHRSIPLWSRELNWGCIDDNDIMEDVAECLHSRFRINSQTTRTELLIPHLSLKIGSVRMDIPSNCTRPLAWPIHVYNNAVGGGLKMIGSGLTTGSV